MSEPIKTLHVIPEGEPCDPYYCHTHFIYEDKLFSAYGVEILTGKRPLISSSAIVQPVRIVEADHETT